MKLSNIKVHALNQIQAQSFQINGMASMTFLEGYTLSFLSTKLREIFNTNVVPDRTFVINFAMAIWFWQKVGHFFCQFDVDVDDFALVV